MASSKPIKGKGKDISRQGRRRGRPEGLGKDREIWSEELWGRGSERKRKREGRWKTLGEAREEEGVRVRMAEGRGMEGGMEEGYV